MNQPAENYEADQIQVLEGLEAVRKKTWYVHRFHRSPRSASSCL